MSIPVFRYNQNKQEYISFILSFEQLNYLSKVLIYGDDEGGYQRKPNPAHILKIKNYVVSNIDTFKLPTSIILGADKTLLQKYIKTDAVSKIESIDVKDIPSETFRIVDGQHRIKGLKKALEDIRADQRNKIQEYKFNVICVITDENNRSVELDIFVDINSKSKKVSTDLAALARYNYEITEHKLVKNISNISEHIAMKAARALREEDKSVWHYAIKFDIHSETNIGIIGVSAFSNSIIGIIQKSIQKDKVELLQLNDKALIEACEIKAKEISSIVSRCWNVSVYNKWPNCFKENTLQDDFEQIVQVKFSDKHYIQKPLGTKSINKIIEESIDTSTTLENAFNHFDKIITTSNLKNEHWKTGGIFSGLNSEGGFKKIREFIKNERSIPNS